MTTTTGWLDTLSDLGILSLVDPTGPPIRLTSTSLLTTQAQPSQLAGSLGPGLSLDKSVLASAPKKQPPLFWKAFGFCIKSRFTISGGLYDEGRALFLGDLGQNGVSAENCPAEVTNYQVFIHGDTMQTLNKPTFSTNGGSYFEFLNLYLKYVGKDDGSGNVSRARNALIESKHTKDQAWERARNAYAEEQRAKSVVTPVHLIDYINKDAGYLAAWNEEEKAERKFLQLLPPALTSVARQMEQVRLADMRMEPQKGNNMKVIAVDKEWLANRASDVDPGSVYYRPEYVLPNYQTTATYWIKNGPLNSMERDGPYDIPLAEIWDRKWSDLGHPLLDEAQPSEKLTDESKAFINSLSATVTFLQLPYANDIRRGLWDIQDPRGRFPLEDDAPPIAKSPFCKTTRLILAWGLEIELTVPETVDITAVGKVTLASMDLPLKRVGKDGRKMVFLAGGHSFPILVGAIAEIV